MGNDRPPVSVTFLWHMHQPLYKNPEDGHYLLPWVRLHATKDYFDMAALIETVPQMRAVINFVPSLFVQLEDYAQGTAKDPFLEYSSKPASKLSDKEKLFLLNNFFTVNKKRKIDPSARYSELWKKKAQAGSEPERLLKSLSLREYLDLQVLFNLAWCGPTLRKDPQVASLIVKDRNFTQEEKELLLAKQQELISRIIPAYRRLQEQGRIEVSVSPFYHPLLPLLCDSDSAEEAQPGITLPHSRFTHPEDAEEQIRLALQYYRQLFGTEARGMWPPEGGVSNKALELAIRQGLKWIATDESILKKSASFGEKNIKEIEGCFPSEKICSPYLYKTRQGELSIFFRSQALSNLISFVYSSWDEEKAADDFFRQLLALNSCLKEGPGPYIISIIMDGENAWEYFPQGGEVFLLSLYQKIAACPQFKPVTFSEFLSMIGRGHQNSIAKISPGSWINGNFSTWIGEPVKNKAWDYLDQARKALEEFIARLSLKEKKQKRKAIEKALKTIYVVEGSDWFWWLQSGEQAENERKFSIIMKLYLKEVYKTLELEIPAYLRDIRSIKQEL
jgi:alpha-amylase/alpha-mannosidase (GH57 family)